MKYYSDDNVYFGRRSCPPDPTVFVMAVRTNEQMNNLLPLN